VYRITLRVVAMSLFTILALLSLRLVTAGAPVNLLVSNVRDTSFTVSWLTAVEEVGQVQLIGGASVDDVRGADFRGVTHYVVVTGLQPGQPYQFDIISGAEKHDNAGMHWTVRTGATLAAPTPDPIVGQVKNPDGASNGDAIVFFTIQRDGSISAPLSALAAERDGGFFQVNLSDARGLSDPDSYFVPVTNDHLTIQAISAHGIGALTVEVGDPRLRASEPHQAIVIPLRTAMETPTIVVRTPLPTAAPTSTTPSAEVNALWLGLGIGVLIVVGVIVVAVLFVWRK